MFRDVANLQIETSQLCFASIFDDKSGQPTLQYQFK